MEEDDNKFEITCQRCNGSVTCKGRYREMIYITFLHSVLSTLELYHEELDPINFYFQWPDRTKIQRMYQNLLKEINGSQKFLRCPDI